MEIQWAAIVLSASYIVLLVAVLYQIAKVRYSSRVCGARVISSFGPCRSSSGGAHSLPGRTPAIWVMEQAVPLQENEPDLCPAVHITLKLPVRS